MQLTNLIAVVLCSFLFQGRDHLPKKSDVLVNSHIERNRTLSEIEAMEKNFSPKSQLNPFGRNGMRVSLVARCRLNNNGSEFYYIIIYIYL